MKIVKNSKGIKNFECRASDSKFSEMSSMKEQMDSVHEGKKPFKCNICDSSFTRNHSLKTHIASVHEGNKPFQCSTCKHFIMSTEFDENLSQ